MIKIQELVDLGLKINWTLIYIGFSETFEQELEAEDIINYAINMLDCTDNPLIIELACTNEKNTQEIIKILNKLSEKENCDYKTEYKKLVIAYVKKNLVYHENFIDGLVDLTSMWAKFGYPEFSPHVVQGKNNDISPEDYYTKKNYDLLFQDHQSWIEDEIEKLSNK